MLFWLSIAMTVVANTAYVLCTKLTAKSVHPLVSLSVSYAVSLVICLALYPFLTSAPGYWDEVRRVNLASVVLGLSIVLLETGFILAFRSGWNLGFASLFSNASCSILLVPISVYVFKGEFAVSHALGMAFAVAGLWLMVR